MLRGVLGPGTPHLLASQGTLPAQIVTDYPFTVRTFLGPPPPPYERGATITLRKAGGVVNGVTEVSEDAPVLAAGQDLYVLVRDQGAYLGGNTATTVVVALSTDVLTVQNGAVHGQGLWAQFVEPVATFEQHFSQGNSTPVPTPRPGS